MTKSKPKRWQYGDPAPQTWRETADILKSFRKPAPKLPKPEKEAK